MSAVATLNLKELPRKAPKYQTRMEDPKSLFLGTKLDRTQWSSGNAVASDAFANRSLTDILTPSKPPRG